MTVDRAVAWALLAYTLACAPILWAAHLADQLVRRRR